MATMTDGNMYMMPEKQGFGKFLWNSEKKEFLGRTGSSWAKIGIFYVLFYLFLAGWFAAMLTIFFQTLDTENRPKYAFGESILRNPAMGFRPRPRAENVESTLIWYKNGDPEDIKHWVNELNTHIANYEGRSDDGQHIRDCSFEQYAEEKAAEKQGTPRPTQACKFQDTWLRGSSSNTQSYCHKAESWGYNRESPCILLKLNKIIDWEPDVYTSSSELPADMPVQLREHMKSFEKNNQTIPPMAWVSCEGENPADNEYLPSITYLPFQGFPAYYFPYQKNAAYRSPLVAVQFSNPQLFVIMIDLIAWFM